jgi:hypothetical protein
MLSYASSFSSGAMLSAGIMVCGTNVALPIACFIPLKMIERP